MGVNLYAAEALRGTIPAIPRRAEPFTEEETVMKLNSVITLAAMALFVPFAARAQSKVTCADNTIVASKAACESHGGVQKPGGLNRVGKEIGKAATDVGKEAKRTPENVETGAKTMGHNVSEAAGDVGGGAKKTAKKVKHGTGQAAGDVSKTAQKTVHPKTYKAKCTDGTTWEGRSKSNACKNHGEVANWR